jgi:ribonuclease HI
MEPFAILRALRLAEAEGWRRIKLRSDWSKRKKLTDQHRRGSEVNDAGIEGEILRLARQFDEVLFGYVRRQKNQMARRLARDFVSIERRQWNDENR